MQPSFADKIRPVTQAPTAPSFADKIKPVAQPSTGLFQSEANNLGSLKTDLGKTLNFAKNTVTGNIPGFSANAPSSSQFAADAMSPLNAAGDAARFISQPVVSGIQALASRGKQDPNTNPDTGFRKGSILDSIAQKAKGFSQNYPDVAKAYGSASDVATTAGLAMGASDLAHSVASTFSPNAKNVAKTLTENLGYDPEEAANINNTLANNGKALQYTSQGNYKAAQAILEHASEDTSLSTTAAQEIKDAYNAVSRLSTVPMAQTGLSEAGTIGKGLLTGAGRLALGTVRHIPALALGGLGAYESLRPGGLLSQLRNYESGK